MALGVHVARAAIATGATGTADVTDSGFGTYKLALAIGSRHASGDSDDAAIAGASLSFGFALDNDDECGHRVHDRDNNANQKQGGGQVGSLGGGGFYGVGDNGSNSASEVDGHQTVITDGVQLVNTKNDNALAANVIIAMLNGSDIANIEMGFHTLNTTAGDYSVTNSGSFEPHLILLQMGNHKTYTSSWVAYNDGRHQLGWATNGDITGGGDLQMAINNDSDFNEANAKPVRTVRNDCMLCGLDDTPALRFKVALKGFISNGFDITTTDGSNSPTGEFMWVAIKFASSTVEPRILFRDAPTSTGDDGGFTGLGIDPDFAWIVQTPFASGDINTIQNNDKAGMLSHAFVEKAGSIAYCASYQVEHGAATTNTECTTSAKAAFMPRDDGDISAGNCYDVTAVTLQTDGIKRTWGKVFTAARQEIILAIGPATAGGAPAFLPITTMF